jgi:hypothetical protein
MNDTTKKAMTEDLRHLIYVQLQFDWRGETDLPVDFMKRLDARAWIAEGEDNGEFYITDEGEEAINTHLSAQRDGEAVAFTSIDDLERLHDDGGGIGRVEVNSRATAHRNVPLYISPPHPNLEVTEELAERVAEALQQNGWASGADYEEDFLPDVRAAVEAALLGNAP